MIQRIQSVWLFLASMAGLAGLKFPFYAGTDPKGIPSSTLEATDNIPLLVGTIAFAVISLIAIFLFSNRSTQMKLTIGAALMQCVVLFLYFKDSNEYIGGTFALTAVLQGFALLFVILAIMGISKDNKIIKESNRLR